MKQFKFSNLFVCLIAGIALGAIMTMLQSGCATSSEKVVTPYTNALGQIVYVTNTLVTVNQAVLDIEAGAVTDLASFATSEAIKKDPSAKPILIKIQTGLTGVINGAGTNSTAQIIGLFSNSGNATITSEFAPVVTKVSQIEQSLITKYGSTVAGQIILAFAKALLAGITQGLL